MAGRPSRGLERALHDLATALASTGVQWMVIGGIAVIARGVRRFTADIDATIRGDELDVAAAITALKKRRIAPRIPRAEAFARANLVLLLRHAPSGVEFDVSFAWTKFEHDAIAAATLANFGSAKAPMAQPEDLVVFKAIAGRGKDHDDIVALLTLYPSLDVARIRARVKELAVLADSPEVSDGLELAIRASLRRSSISAPNRPRSRVLATREPHTPKGVAKPRAPATLRKNTQRVAKSRGSRKRRARQ